MKLKTFNYRVCYVRDESIDRKGTVAYVDIVG